jgi:serine/threonine-protein kinase
MLDAVGQRNAALRRELEELLRAHAAHGAIDDVQDVVHHMLTLPLDGRRGQRVGPYRLMQMIELGGMGAVYLAEREDDFSQRVAVKLIRGGFQTQEVVRRFLAERQILARLEHANIARLLDGGITDQDQPYFAIEYVEGVPIRQYCESNNLPLDERLRLFGQVCAAVHYAHQNLVVHRDLKPDNILVTADRQVKLLDFGIAKLLEAESQQPGSRTTLRWLTPEYAAPEQVRGDPITTSADIYALGLILYELLTGQRAYECAGASPGQIEHIVTTVEPVKPSSVVKKSALRRQLSGDLDTIALRALHKDPARRYASALQLAEDIERHCAGLPVLARPDTVTYRASRFVRRHRVALLALTIILVTLLAGVVGTGWQARAATEQTRVAQEERVRARLEAERAEQVSKFVVDIFRSADPRDLAGDTVSVRALLERRRAQIARALSDQPLLHASVLDAIGRIYMNLGRYTEALQVQEQALALRRSRLGPVHAEVATSLTQLGNLHSWFSRYDLAEPLLLEALNTWNQLPDRRLAERATTLSSLADVDLVKQDYVRAEQRYREALKLRRQALGPDHPEVASDIHNLATLFLHARPELADSLFSSILLVQRKRLPLGTTEYLQTLDGLGAARYRLGKLDDAEALHREALIIRRRLLNENDPENSYTTENLGLVAEKRGDVAAAQSYFRQTLAARRSYFGAGHSALARPLTRLGKLLHTQGKCAEARPLLGEALEIRQRLSLAGSAQITELRALLAACSHPLLSQRH